MTAFDLSREQRMEIFERLIPELENYYGSTSDQRVTPVLEIEEIKKYVRGTDFKKPLDTITAINSVIDGLKKYIVHTPHPRYYGLFNPRPNFPSVIADLITATFNPQLAAWSHSPFASEVESYLIEEFGKKLGFQTGGIDGVFATGGAEANITAVLCALNHAFPGYSNEGLISLRSRPLLYCSSEAHHSVIRAARTSGLGKDSVRMIPVSEKMEIITEILEKKINSDLSDGFSPFMIIGTAGTTGSGSIDDLNEIASISKKYNLWYHIDSAWGGAAVMNESIRHFLSGIEKADSLTFDVHKWLSVPMSASMFITPHNEILGKTFRIETSYMPKDAENMNITDPYTHSIQWSRRFIGLKLYLSMMVFGWEGYSEVIGHQVEMGNLLRSILKENGWLVLNHTPLPLVCFTDEKHMKDPFFAGRICNSVVKSGDAWISVYPVNGINTLRACITNYNTSSEDIKQLVRDVSILRDRL